MRQRRGSLTPAWQSRIGVFKLLQQLVWWFQPVIDKALLES